MSIDGEAAAEFRRLYAEMHQHTITEMERIAEDASERAIIKTLNLMGIDTRDPFKAQRTFMVIQEIANKAMDADYRKDIEHARKWRLEMEKEDGAAVDLRHARTVRKFVGAVFNKVSVTAGASVLLAGLTLWWNDILHAIQKTPPPPN